MNPLDSYLAKVAHELRLLPQAKRDDELRELRSHLEQRVEDFVRDGLSPAAAQTQALHDFGSPRSLGAGLRDTWETGTLSRAQLLSAIGRVSLFWFCATFQLLIAVHSSFFWPQSVLFPELPYIIALVSFCIPLTCGWLWSNCIGTRQVPLLFFVITLNMLFWGSVLARVNGRILPTADPLYDSILVLNSLLAVAGIYLTRAFCSSTHHLSLTSGHTISTKIIPTGRWTTQLIYLCTASVIGAGLWRHISTTLHPTDPVATLRASLLSDHNPDGFDGMFEPPTILNLQRLPATAPAEKEGSEVRVSFLLEIRADQREAQRQANYLKSRLALPGIHSPQLKTRIRQSISTLQRNHHTVSGTARVVQTPDGWQVEESSFVRSQLWSWYYSAISPSSSEFSRPR